MTSIRRSWLRDPRSHCDFPSDQANRYAAASRDATTEKRYNMSALRQDPASGFLLAHGTRRRTPSSLPSPVCLVTSTYRASVLLRYIRLDAHFLTTQDLILS